MPPSSSFALLFFGCLRPEKNRSESCRSADELTTFLGAYTHFRKGFSSMDVVINHVHMYIS